MATAPTPAAAPAPVPDGADPSMEEILASIRRILNDDEVPVVPADAAASSPPEDDVLVLDDSMIVSDHEDVPGEAETAAVAATAIALDVAPPPLADPPPREMEARTSIANPQDLAEQSDLVAPEAVAAAAMSVGSLMRTLAAGRATQVYSGGPTLEDIVRSELRPLLKEWLDANLPPVVERLVRAEIERVVARAVP
jgi:cell pole-organizing protein PopZ